MPPEELRAAWAALVRGEWEVAREGFERVLEREPRSGEALDGLAQAVWWLDDHERFLDVRTRAYAELMREGRHDRAGEAAISISAHFRIAGNASLADGWLGRAERALAACPDCLGSGWLAVERAKRAADPAEAAGHAAQAVEIGRRIGDEGIEASGLGQQGLARVMLGDVSEGVALLDEAILVALAARSDDPLAISDACCSTLVASELLDDAQRGLDWSAAVSDFVERRGFLPLASWCRAIYAGFLIATGRWAEAEEQLAAARRLPPGRGSGPTAVRLADLRLRQGRVEEAAAVLDGLEDRPAALEVAVRLLLVRGDTALAREKVERRLAALDRRAEPLAGAPPRAVLLRLRAEVALAEGDTGAALADAAALRDAARDLRRRDLEAAAAVLEARAGAGEPEALEAAVAAFADLRLPLEECAARLELARALAAAHGRLAVEQARAAHATACRLGAARHADEAAALLRELGAPPGPPPRRRAELTRREEEVLALVAEGLSNPEIADRLVLSPKTVEHHVSRVLAKLGARNRAEAAALAARGAR